MLQPKLDPFYGFCDTLPYMTGEHFSKLKNTDNAMSMTTTNLSSSNTLSQNMVLRKTLKQAI